MKTILRGDRDWIVMRALEKDRTRRYEAANEFAEDISRYLTGDVVSACPPSTGYRLKKYVRKHKERVASLATIAMLLVAGVTTASWLAISAKIERDRADVARRLANNKTAEVEAEKENVELQRNRTNDERNRAAEERTRAEKALEQTEATLARSNDLLAVARWDDNRVGEANESVDRASKKHRQFEWHLARWQFRGSYATLYGHLGEDRSVAFSPVSARIVSGHNNSTLMLWDASTGEELRTLKGHSDIVYGVAFSADGERVLSEDSAGKKFAWTTASGKRIENVGAGVLCIGNKSPDQRWLVLPSGNDVLLVELEFKNTPHERAYREFKTRPRPQWHLEQATKAEAAND